MREISSRSLTASRRRTSRATTPAKPSRAGVRPPTTDVPPANGTTATRCRAQASSTATTSSCVPGKHDGVRRIGSVAAAELEQVGRRPAAGVQHPRLGIGADVLGADRVDERSGSVGRQRAVRQGRGAGVDRRRRGLDAQCSKGGAGGLGQLDVVGAPSIRTHLDDRKLGLGH